MQRMRPSQMIFTTIERWERGAAWGVGAVVVLLLVIIILLIVLLWRQPTSEDYSKVVRQEVRELLTKDPEVAKLFSSTGSGTLDSRMEKLISDVNIIIGERGNFEAFSGSLDERLARIEECACPKKKIHRPKSPMKPVARPPVRPVAPVVQAPVVTQPIFIPPPVVSRPPLDDIPQVTCPPDRPRTLREGRYVCIP